MQLFCSGIPVTQPSVVVASFAQLRSVAACARLGWQYGAQESALGVVEDLAGARLGRAGWQRNARWPSPLRPYLLPRHKPCTARYCLEDRRSC